MDTLNSINPTYTLNCRGKLLSLSTPRVMGILNTTPDSFFDGGQYNNVDNALLRAEKLLADGADIIDVGGYSSRPGARDIDENEELARVIPVIEQLAAKFPELIISIDTFRGRVAEEAIAAGAAIINDISGGDDDAVTIPLVARLNVPYIIMHKQGTPQTMQQNPQYGDVVQEVLQYLADKVAHLRSLHVKDILVDPGFGFGKTQEHNYKLLSNLGVLNILGVPILAGLSRKSMATRVLGVKPTDALNATTALNTIALLNGAHLLRVHDVKEAVETIQLVQFYKNNQF